MTSDSRTLTTRQVAAVIGAEVRQVDKMIDRHREWRGLLAKSTSGGRLVPENHVVLFSLERRLSGTVDARARRMIMQAIRKTPQARTVRINNLLTVEVATERQRVRDAISRLRRAERQIVRDPEVMSGQPVFRGTRIPVQMIVEMLDQGTAEDRLLEAYPSLSKDKLDLARLFIRASPQRGRPVKAPWRSGKPVRRAKVRLSGREA